MIIISRMIEETRVSIVCLPPQEALAEDVLTTLERIAAREPLCPGTRIRFGWSVLTLREENDGGLIVCEPDFANNPLRDVRPELSTTLDILAQQTAFARRVGVVPVDVTFDQYIIVSRGSLASDVLHLLRLTSSGADDSGWSISSGDQELSPDNPENFDPKRVYELLALRPAVLPVLILPPGFAAVLDRDDTVSAVFDTEGNELMRTNP